MRISKHVGRTFGDLTVLSVAKVINRTYYYNCRCKCGKEAVYSLSRILSCKPFRGHSHLQHSVGGAIHHHSRRPENNFRCSSTYKSWSQMIQRCNNPKYPYWKNYGGRGIMVCERWSGFDGFINFLEDVGVKPEGKTPSGKRNAYTLERINNEGNYEPGNVKWATYKENVNNSRPKKRRRST